MAELHDELRHLQQHTSYTSENNRIKFNVMPFCELKVKVKISHPSTHEFKGVKVSRNMYQVNIRNHSYDTNCTKFD